MDWEEIYRARPVSDVKDFPFLGASNLVVPVAATDIETLTARMMGMLFDQPGLWTAEALRPELTSFAPAVTEFLKWGEREEIKPYRDVGNWLLELHKLGTGVNKQRYTREMKKVYEWREMQDQTWQQQAIIMLKDHPTWNHVRLHDFFLPAGFPTIQPAPWCAERVRLTWTQFMNRVKSGLYVNADQVGKWFFNPPINRVQQVYDQISNYQPSINQQMEFYEFWLDFDIDGDGWDEALVCTIHLDSQTYVRLDYNPFFNQEKPYSSANFQRDVNSFYGIGLCEMLDHYQEEITAMHNQRIDSGTVANSAMYAVRRDNQNIKQNEPVYPSKVWRVGDPKNDIVRLPLGAGDAIAGSIQSEQETRAGSRQRTGVNDFIQGNPNPTSAYGSAFATQQMELNSGKKLGETLREVNNSLAEGGVRIMELYQQYNPAGKPFVALGMQDGQMVDMILKMPTDLIRKGLRITVSAIDAQNSKDAQIRTTTIVFQTLQQFYMNYMQMVSYAANPQMPPAIQAVALQAADGSSVLMKRLLALYDIQDSDKMLPALLSGISAQQQTQNDIQQILLTGQIANQSAGRPSPGPFAGATGAPGGPQAAPGLQGLYPSSAPQLGFGGPTGGQFGGGSSLGLPSAGQGGVRGNAFAGA